MEEEGLNSIDSFLRAVLFRVCSYFSYIFLQELSFYSQWYTVSSCILNTRFHRQNAAYIWIMGWNWHMYFKLHGFERARIKGINF